MTAERQSASETLQLGRYCRARPALSLSFLSSFISLSLSVGEGGPLSVVSVTLSIREILKDEAGSKPAVKNLSCSKEHLMSILQYSKLEPGQMLASIGRK